MNESMDEYTNTQQPVLIRPELASPAPTAKKQASRSRKERRAAVAECMRASAVVLVLSVRFGINAPGDHDKRMPVWDELNKHPPVTSWGLVGFIWLQLLCVACELKKKEERIVRWGWE